MNFFEKQFSIFTLIFLTEILAFSSLFISPDAKATEPAASNPLSSVLSLLQYVIYGVTFLLLLARYKNTIRVAIRDKLVWILAGLALFSFIWSDFPDLSQKRGITLFQSTYFGLYLASRFTIKQQLNILAWTFGIVSIVSLLFGLAFPGAAIEAGVNAGAFRGPFTQKNVLARIAVLGALVFFLVALDSKRFCILPWSGFCLCLLLVLLTTSKTGLLLLVLLITLVPLYHALRWKGKIITPLVIVGILFFGTIAILLISNWEAALLSVGRDPSLSGRTQLWEAAIEKISERPFLGYGYQAFWLEDGGAYDIWRREGYKPPHAHNGFINMALDFGLIGLSLFLLTLATNYTRSIVWLRANKSTLDLWPICYITFFFMYNYSENTIVQHNSIFWVLLVSSILSMGSINRTIPHSLKP